MQKRELTKDDRNAGMALGHMFYELSEENSNAGGLAVVCAAFTRIVPLLKAYELFALVETNQEMFCKYMRDFESDGNAYVRDLVGRALKECSAIFDKYQNKNGESINNVN